MAAKILYNIKTFSVIKYKNKKIYQLQNGVLSIFVVDIYLTAASNIRISYCDKTK